MFRLGLAYFLSTLILVSQVGLPVHYHFCNGSLASVSLLFRSACSEAEALTKSSHCCEKELANQAHDESDDCCHDTTYRVAKVFQTVAPQLNSWDAMIVVDPGVQIPFHFYGDVIRKIAQVYAASDSGPPIYLKYHALIFYA